MEKQVNRKKEIVISIFILLGLGLIFIQLVSNIKESQPRKGNEETVFPSSNQEKRKDSIKEVRRDSLWEGTEFIQGE